MITIQKSEIKAMILFSKVRRAVFSLLFGHANEAFYLRQIVRMTGFGLGPIQRELKQLTQCGIIRRSVRGRQVYFQANLDSPIFPELKGLIIKTTGIGDTLRAALAPIASQLEVAFIYGSIARGEEGPRSDIDLLVVGDIAFADVVVNLQAAQKLLGREIFPTVYPPDEFKAKMRAKHHFLTSVLKGPKIYLIGDENELRRLATKRLARRA
ncbi:MAG: nucleotidyltransferase domain-containing protein [Clostridiales bacterium]|nr:nucleotidyltransferase domain-containing protein [Clostridiales bacterium]